MTLLNPLSMLMRVIVGPQARTLFQALFQHFESNTMKEKLIDIVFAIVLGLIFAGFALAYFDVLTK
jgi:O-antigen/teichoic acid export membrane protein